MRCLVASAGGLVLLLRRRSCSGPLLLIGVAVCLFYQNRLRSGPPLPAADVRCGTAAEEPRGFVSSLEALHTQVSSPAPSVVTSQPRLLF